MEPNLPATRAATHEEHGLVLDTTHDLHGDHLDPQRQVTQQSVRVALLPLAIVALLVLTFVAAAWTFLAALPHA
jgi:hypothetical protein